MSATRTTTAARAAAPAREAPRRGAIDPRIRARRAEVLRAEARRRLRRTLAVTALLVVVAGGWLGLHTKLFAARVVTVVGAVHTPASAVIAAGGLTNDPPLIDVGSGTAARIERLPWVAKATVERRWPDGVRVVVTERTPVAAVAQDAPAKGWAIVDRSGKVLADEPQVPAGLVQVAGPVPPGAPGSTVAGARAALAVAATLPKAFASQVVEVQEARSGDVTLHLTSPLTVYLGSTASLHQKYEDTAAVLAGASLASGDVIDVSVPDAPVVRS